MRWMVCFAEIILVVYLLTGLIKKPTEVSDKMDSIGS